MWALLTPEDLGPQDSPHIWEVTSSGAKVLDAINKSYILLSCDTYIHHCDLHTGARR